MVESALFFVVGFLCAALLALMAGPAVSRRAMRLATARARLQAPLSEAQARAERDALRAVQAVELVRMEKKVAIAEWERAVARTELARETNRFRKLDSEVRKLTEELDQRDAEVDKLERSLRGVEAEAGAKELALLDVGNQRDAAQQRLVDARIVISDLEANIDRNRVEIAALSTQVSALEIELSNARGSSRRFGGDGSDDLERTLRSSEVVRAEQTLEIARMMRSTVELQDSLARSERAREELVRRLASSEERARAVETDLRSKLQSAVTERATSQGALAAERSTRRELETEVTVLRDRLVEAAGSAESFAKGDAALRLAIAKLGRDFVRIRAQNDDEPHGVAQIVNFARREPMA